MTLSEAKAQIRYSRRLLTEWRAAYNGQTRSLGSGLVGRPVALNLSQPDYDAMGWGMRNLQKAWLYDLDDEGERIPGTGVLTRMRHCMFVAPGRVENFMFKGIPVYCAEPVGLVR
jgi:hypothetical protein